MSVQFTNQDCFDLLPTLSDQSINLIICDLPYGTTQCKWDVRLPLDKLWTELWRVSKPTCPILMFASQPFTSILVSSQLETFKYEWIWEKSKASNFLDAKRKPLKAHESILVFCRQSVPYYPQMTEGSKYDGSKRAGKKATDVYGKVRDVRFRNDNDGFRYPRSVIYFKTAESEGKVLHSTQKPVALLEYMILTYTTENAVVLDPCAGSASSAVAANNLKRSFVGCEKDEKIFALANARMSKYNANDIFADSV